MDTQVIELLGRNRLVDELLRAGLEVATPARDRGIDLIAYADLVKSASEFVSRPIQMKAASTRHFSIWRKYERFNDLILAFVWHLNAPSLAVTYAMTYPDAVVIGEKLGWTKTASWTEKGYYSTSQPSKRLVELLAPSTMNDAAWWHLITRQRRQSKS